MNYKDIEMKCMKIKIFFLLLSFFSCSIYGMQYIKRRSCLELLKQVWFNYVVFPMSNEDLDPYFGLDIEEPNAYLIAGFKNDFKSKPKGKKLKTA